MKNRKKIPRKQSGKMFTRTAKKVNPKNGMGRPLRGGIRL